MTRNGDLLTNAVTSTAVSLLAVATIVLHFWRVPRHDSKKKKKQVPKADVGMLQALQEIAVGRMNELLLTQFQKKGNVYQLPLPGGVVVFSDGDDARAICKNSHHLKPSHMYRSIDSFSNGPSLLSIGGGQNWHHRRKAVNVAFASKCVQRMKDVALEKAQQWITDTLLPLTDRKEPFDVNTTCIHLTIQIICKAAFDFDISEQNAKDILRSIRLCSDEFTNKAMYNPFRRFATWLLPDRQQAFRESANLKTFACDIMQRYRANPSPTPDTVIDCIMRNSTYKDDSERIPDIIVILLAGHDTTGFALAGALLSVAKYPAEQELLRKRLAAENDDSSIYLRAFLNESMRMYPATPMTAIKELGSDFTSKEGYVVPKGSSVFIGHITRARDPQLFPDPFVFRPSRWMNPTEEAKDSLFHFSLGARNCVGQALAKAELETVLPLVLRQFTFSVHIEGRQVLQGTMRFEDCLLKVSKIDGEATYR